MDPSFKPSAARLIWWDDGLKPGPENAALDRALLAHAAAGAEAAMLRLHRHRPTASIGRLQALGREVRLRYCAESGVAVARRVTGGGALYLDSGQLTLSLVAPSAALGETLAERLKFGAGAIAAALAQLDVATAFKAPNDLETPDRRKIASVFAAEAGSATLLFATILVTIDIAAAMAALLIPTEKLTQTGLEHARERLTALTDCLGAPPARAVLEKALVASFAASLGRAAEHGRVDGAPAEPLAAEDGWDDTAEAFETADKADGATLRLRLALDNARHVRWARFALDAHLSPPDLAERLAAALVGQPVATLASEARAWLARHPADSVGAGPDDLVRLIARAADKQALQGRLGLTPRETSRLMLAGPRADSAATLAEASVMLAPYCAKPAWCKFRHSIDCVECGQCAVGDAYAMARDRNMEVVTITNFEHLSETLGRMRAAGVTSYVGMCCGEFFLKRHQAFRHAGMDGVLIDIDGATCYELKQEQLAYAGVFKAEATLDLPLVAKVMEQVRPCAQRPVITDAGPRPGDRAASRRCADCPSAPTNR